MSGRPRLFLAFLAAVLLMAVLGTIVQTQFVLAALAAVGAPLTLSDRLAMTGADLVGFAPVYALVIAVGLLVAFAVAGFLSRRLKVPHVLVFVLAGAAAIALMLVLMRLVFFGIPLIAGTRTMAGTLAQIACGALAGLVFALAAPRKPGTR